jgi:hypothetical protein
MKHQKLYVWDVSMLRRFRTIILCGWRTFLMMYLVQWSTISSRLQFNGMPGVPAKKNLGVSLYSASCVRYGRNACSECSDGPAQVALFCHFFIFLWINVYIWKLLYFKKYSKFKKLFRLEIGSVLKLFKFRNFQIWKKFKIRNVQI